MPVGAGYAAFASDLSGTITALTTAGGTTQATGSTFIAVVALRDNGSVLEDAIVTDFYSNTYIKASSATLLFGEQKLGIYYCINGSGGGGHTATATWLATHSSNSIAFAEFTSVGAGTVGSAPAAVDNTGGSPITAPSITTAIANELVVNAFVTFGQSATTIGDSGAPWSIVVKQELATGHNGAVSYQVVSGSGSSVADAFTFTAFDFSTATALSIKPAAAPASSLTNWPSIRPLNPPGRSPGKFGRFYQIPQARNAIFYRGIEGIASASTHAVGNLTGIGALSGTALAGTAAAGNLLGSGVLSGIAVSTVSSAANLLGSGALSGVCVAVTVDTGDLQPFSGNAISGTAVASSAALGNLLGSGGLSGTSVGTTDAVGTLTGIGGAAGISVVGSRAIGNLTGQGILSGVSGSTTVLVANLAGSGALSGVAAATTLALGDLQPFSAGSMSGISIATTYAVANISSSFTPPTAAGGKSRRKRYGVIDGTRLLIFATQSQATAARRAIESGRISTTEAPIPALRRINVSPPLEVVPLKEVEQVAQAAHAGPQFRRLLKAHDSTAIARQWEHWRAREEEDIARAMLTQDQVERAELAQQVSAFQEALAQWIKSKRGRT